MEYINHNLDKDQIFNISKISSSRNDAIKIENQKIILLLITYAIHPEMKKVNDIIRMQFTQ
jgi:hypothetical protein